MNSFKINRVLQDCFELKLTSDALFYKSKKRDFKLCEIFKETLEIKWESIENITYYTVNESYIILNNQNQETWIIKKDDKKINYKIPLTLSFNDKTSSSNLFVGNSKKGICIFDYNNNSYHEYETDNSVIVVDGYKVICINDKKNNVIVYDNLFSTLWQFDISQFGTYKDKKIFANKDPEVRQREINRVYYHNNKIIVTLSRAIIALNPDNGELIWKIDFDNYDPVTLLFDGNIAYSGRLIYFAIIDIEKGVKLFEKDFDPSYRFEIEGFKLSQIRYIGLTLHENHLWFTHEDKGHQFLLKANPKNGDIEDGMLLETKLPTHPPQFDENRMYILDQEGNLYIYERA